MEPAPGWRRPPAKGSRRLDRDDNATTTAPVGLWRNHRRECELRPAMSQRSDADACRNRDAGGGAEAAKAVRKAAAGARRFLRRRLRLSTDQPGHRGDLRAETAGRPD